MTSPGRSDETSMYKIGSLRTLKFMNQAESFLMESSFKRRQGRPSEAVCVKHNGMQCIDDSVLIGAIDAFSSTCW